MERPSAAVPPMDWSSEVKDLLRQYIQYKDSSTTKWNRSDPQVASIHENVVNLFSRDYDVQLIHNEEGQWCATYPLLLIIIAGEKAKNHINSKTTIKDTLAGGARFARVRTRFVVPVILFRGKNICRSSTLSHKLETVFQTTANSIKDSLFDDDDDERPSLSKGSISADELITRMDSHLKQVGTSTVSPLDDFGRKPVQQQNISGPPLLMGSLFSPAPIASMGTSGLSVSPEDSRRISARGTVEIKEPSIMDKYRSSDIKLLNILRITHICDLMVENAKKMMGLTVCSSEKKDSHNRYAKFSLNVMPYPGVEFFKEFSNVDPQKAASMYFDWTRTVDPAVLSVGYRHLQLKWEDYQRWDLVTLTQNYLRLMLTMLNDSSCDGLLVHCISGWDRTPMMISLLRLSLWADGEVHQSLSACEVLYLTIAYDWMLYRHQLVHRQSRGEDIFFFCFYFLEFMKGKEFSVHHIAERLSGKEHHHERRSSLRTPLTASLDDIHLHTSGAHEQFHVTHLHHDLAIPMQTIRAALSDSDIDEPLRLSHLIPFDSLSGSPQHHEIGCPAPIDLEEGFPDHAGKTFSSSSTPSESEASASENTLAEPEQGGSWHLVKERNFESFMAEHLQNLPEVGFQPSKAPEIAKAASANTSFIPIHPASHSVDAVEHDPSHRTSLFSSTSHAPIASSSVASSPGSSPPRLTDRKAPNDDLRRKLEKREKRLDEVRSEFMRLHEEHILPETVKLRSSIWSSWFAGFKFK